MKVVIIYNPNSTGSAKANALRFAGELRKKKVHVETRETTHAGHGEEIAAEYARCNTECVLISSSGDGGYHEVVNGALMHNAKKLVVGVLPSGNANDHASALQGENLAEAIVHKRFQRIDTLELTAVVDGKPWKRYAHSYAGIGITATAARRLTNDRPNALTEKWIVLHSLFSFRYVKIEEGGVWRRYSSVLFANIDRMSKVLKLSEDASVTDGKFEIHSIRFRSKIRLLVYFLTAALIGLGRSRSVGSYSCRVRAKTNIQLDGESFCIDAGCSLKVRCAPGSLLTVL